MNNLFVFFCLFGTVAAAGNDTGMVIGVSCAVAVLFGLTFYFKFCRSHSHSKIAVILKNKMKPVAETKPQMDADCVELPPEPDLEMAVPDLDIDEPGKLPAQLPPDEDM